MTGTANRPRRQVGLVVIGAAVVLVALVLGVMVARRAPRAESAGSAVAVPVGDPAVRETEDAAPGPPVAPTTTTTTTPTVSVPSLRPPAAVGVATVTVVDESRGTGPRGSRPAVGTRTLPVTVRYPVAGPAGPDEVPDAAPLGTSPLVVFAHGFDVSQQTYAALLHDLAAAGFVVAAPDFPQSSTAFPGPAVEGDEGEQALDVSLVIDRLTDGATAPSVNAAIRPGPVGLVGHSDGAVTVLLAGYSPEYADPRVGAVVDVSGAYDDFGGPWFSTQDPPLLSVHGGADEINPLSADRNLVGADPGEAALVVVDGASHLGALTGPSEPAVARLVADDLAWRLEQVIGGSIATSVDEGVAPLRLEAEHGG